MNLSKKSFIGILILFFVLGVIYHPVDKAKAGVPITVQVKINGSAAPQYVSYGQTIKLSWDSSGDSGRTCTNNFGAPSAQSRLDKDGFSYTVTAGRTFTVTCTNAACISGSKTFTASDTWTVPNNIENCNTVKVEAYGGGQGGGGGVSSTTGGYGGGGGGYSTITYDNSVSNNVKTGDLFYVVVGVGGSGANTGSATGTPGGKTSVSKNGAAQDVYANGGGNASGSTNASKTTGGYGNVTSGTNGSSNLGVYGGDGGKGGGLSGGSGGSGGGDVVNGVFMGADGNNGNSYGGGGGGGYSSSSSVGKGGSGANGLVNISWY